MSVVATASTRVLRNVEQRLLRPLPQRNEGYGNSLCNAAFELLFYFARCLHFKPKVSWCADTQKILLGCCMAGLQIISTATPAAFRKYCRRRCSRRDSRAGR